MKGNKKGLTLHIIIFLFFMFIIYALLNGVTDTTVKTQTLDYFNQQVETKNVTSIEITKSKDADDVGEALVVLKDGSKFKLDVPVMSSFYSSLEEKSSLYGFSYKGMPVPQPSILSEMLPMIIVLLITIAFVFIIFQQMQGGSGNKAMNFGKSRAKMVVDAKKKVTFENVAGLDEEKVELQEIIDFFRQSKRFIEMGARIPKGVLLVGPPGTGKTLLAKAVAGEAGVPFFSISGSDFVEMFVGVGASRVRDLFEQAKKNTPCIIFIDEIDAVGRRRGAGLGGGHDEREQTLNQLLVEMDGFGVNEGIIILAATNRADILDPALLRPGRFDRRVRIGFPDSMGREEILLIHSKGKLIDEDVDFRSIAMSTSGFTGADLENLMNESALLAVRHGKKSIDMEEIRRAFIKVGVGTEKKSRVVSEKEKLITAYHEAGHGILFEVLPELDHVHMISIIPTGGAGGYTMPIPDEDRMYLAKKNMEQDIVCLLGGRAAEELIFDDITTGASSDIERATAIARSMVTKYGMSSVLGPIQFGEDNEEVFIGRSMSHSRNYGEEIASVIDQEVKKIMISAYDRAKELINQYIDVLHSSAKLLIEKEKITGDEFRALFPEGAIKKESGKMDFGNPVNV